MARVGDLKERRRTDYSFMLEYRTRWNDNDMYDHMNNAVYNLLFDSVVNAYLIEHCDLRPATSSQTPLAAHVHTDFISSIAYPAVAELCLRVNKLGRSSVTYEIALFERGVDGVKAVGEFVHVFVDRKTGKPSASGMLEEMRHGLEKIRVQSGQVGSKL